MGLIIISLLTRRSRYEPHARCGDRNRVKRTNNVSISLAVDCQIHSTSVKALGLDSPAEVCSRAMN